MTVESDLERRIAGAFNERARSLPAAAGLAPTSPLPDRTTRRPTRVLAVALVTLLVISGAGVLIAVRRSGKGSVESSGSGAAQYRSTAIVQIAPESSASAPSTPMSAPLELALSHAVRTSALEQSFVRPAGAAVEFGASENAARNLVMLVVSAPTGALATSVARSWADEFAAGRADRRNLALEQERAAGQQLTTSNRELATVDTDLARLDPRNYGTLLQFDEPNGLSSTGGRSAPSVIGPPPVPEQGTPHELNLAFERIQLLGARSKAASKAANLRMLGLVSGIFPRVVSLSPATRLDASK